MTNDMPSYYPVFMNIRGRSCIIIGGGQVAFRKVSSLLDCGASVKVISPDLCRELDSLFENGKITVMKRHYRYGDLAGAFIAIAATNEYTINIEVIKEARSNNIPVNVVDEPDISDFIVPSYLRRGDVTVAISTSGQSPALARKIRLKLEEELSEEYAVMAALVGDVRKEIHSLGIKVTSEEWQNALDLDVLIDLLKNKQIERARSFLLTQLKAFH